MNKCPFGDLRFGSRPKKGKKCRLVSKTTGKSIRKENAALAHKKHVNNSAFIARLLNKNLLYSYRFVREENALHDSRSFVIVLFKRISPNVIYIYVYACVI